VSGDRAGGEILIGGNAHGAGPQPNAERVYVGSNVVMNANALTNGNGGKVVVWSDLGTQYYGQISALGGSISGNGGWVETSGRDYLDVGGMVNTTAINGKTG